MLSALTYPVNGSLGPMATQGRYGSPRCCQAHSHHVGGVTVAGVVGDDEPRFGPVSEVASIDLTTQRRVHCAERCCLALRRARAALRSASDSYGYAGLSWIAAA